MVIPLLWFLLTTASAQAGLSLRMIQAKKTGDFSGAPLVTEAGILRVSLGTSTPLPPPLWVEKIGISKQEIQGVVLVELTPDASKVLAPVAELSPGGTWVLECDGKTIATGPSRRLIEPTLFLQSTNVECPSYFRPKR